jgi:hypothetical protein
MHSKNEEKTLSVTVFLQPTGLITAVYGNNTDTVVFLSNLS